MAKENSTNKIMAIALIIVLLIAAIVVIYVNLPKEDTKDENDQTETPQVSLNITYGDQTVKYTFEDIVEMENISGTGRYLKASPFFSSGTIIIVPAMNETSNQYTGVKISKIIENIDNLPEIYNVTVSAPDGYSTTFNSTEINGEMITYNESGNESLNDVSVILAYKKDGEYLEEKGPLMVAIIGNEPISLSNQWVSNVFDIEII